MDLSPFRTTGLWKESLARCDHVGVSKDDPDLERIESLLGHVFADRSLLVDALTHSSFANEQGTAHNETLEFLGDSVLSLLVSEMLLAAFPDWREGALSKARSMLVSEARFAQKARDLSLSVELRLSPGEQSAGGATRPALLADAFEAVFAAIYKDGGLPPAREAARRLFAADVEGLSLEAVGARDWKTVLQEREQAGGRRLPEYRLSSATGPDHAPEFEFTVSLEGGFEATGRGASKKEAQQDAARRALESVAP